MGAGSHAAGTLQRSTAEARNRHGSTAGVTYNNSDVSAAALCTMAL
jgi:hypothetical protein